MIIDQKLIVLGRKWIETHIFGRELRHHGVKGQKWGVKNGPPYPIKKNKHANISIEDKTTGEKFRLLSGTKIFDVQVFAGKGCKRKLREETAIGLSKQIGGKPSEWQYCKGKGTIDYYGEERKAEIHWFQEPSVGKHKFKIKKWLDI